MVKMSGALWGLVLFLSSCVSVPSASPDQDREAKAFVPAPGTASLYIGRKSETMGALVIFRLAVDGQDQGALGQGTYQWVSLTPGPHRVEVSAGLSATAVNVTVEAGKNYFYEAGAKPGTGLLEPELTVVLFEQMGRVMVSQDRRAEGPR